MDEGSPVTDSAATYPEEDPSSLEEGRGKPQETEEEKDAGTSALAEVPPVNLASNEEEEIAVAGTVAKKAARRLANKGVNDRPTTSAGAPDVRSAAMEQEDTETKRISLDPANVQATNIGSKELILAKEGLKRAPNLDTPPIVARAFSALQVEEPGALMVLPGAVSSEHAGAGGQSILPYPETCHAPSIGSTKLLDKRDLKEAPDPDAPYARAFSANKVEEPGAEMVFPGAFAAKGRGLVSKEHKNDLGMGKADPSYAVIRAAMLPNTSNDTIPEAFVGKWKGLGGKRSKESPATEKSVDLTLASRSTESLPGAFAENRTGPVARKGKALQTNVMRGEASLKKAPAGESRALPESPKAAAAMGDESEISVKSAVPGAVVGKGKGLRSKNFGEKPGLKKAPVSGNSAVPQVAQALIPLMVDESEGSVAGAVAAKGRGLRSKEFKDKPGLKKAPAGDPQALAPLANMADESEGSVPGAYSGLRRTAKDQRIKRAALTGAPKTEVDVAPPRSATADSSQEELDVKSSFKQGKRSSDQSQPGAIPQLSDTSFGVGEEGEIVLSGESKRRLRTSRLSKAVLIEARLVTENSRHHDLGDIVEAEAMTSRDFIWEFLKSPRGITTLICLLAVIIAMVIGLVLGLLEMQNEDTVETFEPSSVPSISPTPAPTVEFGLDILPSSTVEKIVDEPDSPQAKAFHWVFEDPFLQVMPPARKMQRFALATLYYATNGDRWVRSDKWLSYYHSECEWFQRSMEQVCGELTLQKLSLPKNGLSGTLPMEVALIEGLEQMDLSENYAEGPIPSEIGMLSDALKMLQLNGNLLGDSIPSEIGYLTNLRELNLANNFLRGSVPSQVGNLMILIDIDLQGNSLFGPLPSELGKLSIVRSFDASENFLSGLIPTELGMIAELGTLRLNDNDIEGSIISEIGLLKELSEIDLSYCALGGNLPTQLGQLENLRSLYLVGGAEGGKLEGSIPSELGRLARLRALWLEGNNFAGSIPTEIGKLSILLDLSVALNKLNGTLPSELGHLTLLQSFAVGGNELTGVPPSQLGTFLQLNSLELSNNKFTGSLPSELWKLQELESLDIDGANFTGCIFCHLPESLKKLHFSSVVPDSPLPEEIGRLTHLELLSASFSNITGTIPSSIGSMTSLTHLSLWDNLLTGPVPSEIGLLQGLSYLDFEANSLSGQIPKEFYQLSRLNTIYLSSNQLTGSIPPSFCDLSFQYFGVECKNVSCSCCDSCKQDS